MGPRLDYALDLPADLGAQPVPALLLQPLVENSIKHGLEPKVEGGRIRVSAQREHGKLLIEVMDTGVGGASAQDGAGFGLAQIRERLPSLRAVVHVPYAGGADDTLPDATSWDDLLGEGGPLAFEQVPFAHPLCVLFSSGTTGLPKAIVHSHGGLLVEHHKNHGLSWDIRAGDRLQWFTTTAWMMWTALVSTLLRRASIVLIDGNPRRAPWIDLGDLRSKGGVVLWTDGDPNVMPVAYRSLAGDAQVQPPFRLQFRRGGRELTVGWAILRPQPAFASR